MNRRLRYGLVLLGLAALSGCGDNADTILRMGANRKSELTDRLAKVTDEQSAKKFTGFYLKNYIEDNRKLDEKWQKWVKDIEEDHHSKKIRVIQFKTTFAPGSDEWNAEARVPPQNIDDPRIMETREAFILYMKHVDADKTRYDREKARIANLVNYFVAEKISQEKAAGNDNPSVDPKTLCPSMVFINDPSIARSLLLTGALKRVMP